jgi:hypothetical protein
LPMHRTAIFPTATKTIPTQIYKYSSHWLGCVIVKSFKRATSQ